MRASQTSPTKNKTINNGPKNQPIWMFTQSNVIIGKNQISLLNLKSSILNPYSTQKNTALKKYVIISGRTSVRDIINGNNTADSPSATQKLETFLAISNTISKVKTPKLM